MKNLCVLAFLVVLSYTPVMASNTLPSNGEEDIVLFDNEVVSYTIKGGFESYLSEVTFSHESSNIHLESKEKINLLQVLDNKGALLYQIPVSAKKVNVAIQGLESGDYIMNLILESSTIVATTIKKT